MNFLFIFSGLMVLKKWKFQVSSFLFLVLWFLKVCLFIIVEIKCIWFLVVEVIRL